MLRWGCCPELNPAEKLWDIVKDGICNQLWEDLKTLEDAITERIRPYWEDARRVKSLIGSSYLPSELNAIPNHDFRQDNYLNGIRASGGLIYTNV